MANINTVNTLTLLKIVLDLWYAMGEYEVNLLEC